MREQNSLILCLWNSLLLFIDNDLSITLNSKSMSLCSLVLIGLDESLCVEVKSSSKMFFACNLF